MLALPRACLGDQLCSATRASRPSRCNRPPSRCPGKLTRLHLALLALHLRLHQNSDSAQGLGVIGTGVFVSEHHKFVAQDSSICRLGQFLNHPKTERFLAADHPEDPVAIEHAQVHEINVGAVKIMISPGLTPAQSSAARILTAAFADSTKTKRGSRLCKSRRR